MKKLAIAFAVLIALAGGTMALLKTLEIGPFAADPNAVVDPNVERDRSMFATRPIYMEMDPLMVPFVSGGDITTYIIDYRLEVMGRDNEEKVDDVRRRLHDALMRDFAYYLPQTLRTNKRIDVRLIKFRIMMVTGQVMGEGVVTDAVIQNVTTPGN